MLQNCSEFLFDRTWIVTIRVSNYERVSDAECGWIVGKFTQKSDEFIFQLMASAAVPTVDVIDGWIDSLDKGRVNFGIIRPLDHDSDVHSSDALSIPEYTMSARPSSLSLTRSRKCFRSLGRIATVAPFFF